MNDHTIRLGNEVYKFTETTLPQAQLKFYVENPRVYSYFDRSEREPTQDEIENALCDMEGVRELKGAIESVGGLVDPLVVVDKRNVVIEGNRRLAAYRLLARKDPTRWSMVRCMVLPEGISEKAIFILLGQYHLHGQLAWAPFELAGYLYRRIEETHVKPETIAKEVSKTPSEIKQFYKVYKFMVEHGDLDAKHWSYYEEYLKNQSIKKRRAALPDLDKAVVNCVKSGEIKDARIDIRYKLCTVSKLPEDVSKAKLESFISREKSLDELAVEAEANGLDIFSDLVRFRAWISKPETTSVVRNLNDDDREKYRYELTQIHDKIVRLMDILDPR